MNEILWAGTAELLEYHITTCPPPCQAFSQISAWFKNSHFRVTAQGRTGKSAQQERSRSAQGTRGQPANHATGSSGLAEPLVTQQFQPVRVRAAGEQLRRAATHPLRMRAAHEPPVVQKEPQKLQVTPTDFFPQEAVVAQAAVHVLHHT